MKRPCSHLPFQASTNYVFSILFSHALFSFLFPSSPAILLLPFLHVLPTRIVRWSFVRQHWYGLSLPSENASIAWMVLMVLTAIASAAEFTTRPHLPQHIGVAVVVLGPSPFQWRGARPNVILPPKDRAEKNIPHADGRQIGSALGHAGCNPPLFLPRACTSKRAGCDSPPSGAITGFEAASRTRGMAD